MRKKWHFLLLVNFKYSMKKVITFLLLFSLLFSDVKAWFYQWQFWPITPFDRKIVTLWTFRCDSWSYDESAIPTIFIPWIMASWYSQSWFEKEKIKRWIPDPIQHTYDPLFFSFKNAGYDLKDVFYDAHKIDKI